MFKKIALAAALIAGTASFAFAEDGSSSFANNIYSPYAQSPRAVAAPKFTTRDAGLDSNGTATGGYDRASSPYAGGGF